MHKISLQTNKIWKPKTIKLKIINIIITHFRQNTRISKNVYTIYYNDIIEKTFRIEVYD